jgi:hypothetical protein
MEGKSKAKAEEWADCGVLIFFFRVSQSISTELSFFRLPLQERDVGGAPPITPSPSPSPIHKQK